MIWVNNPEWGELLYSDFGLCVQFGMGKSCTATATSTSGTTIDGVER